MYTPPNGFNEIMFFAQIAPNHKKKLYLKKYEKIEKNRNRIIIIC